MIISSQSIFRLFFIHNNAVESLTTYDNWRECSLLYINNKFFFVQL